MFNQRLNDIYNIIGESSTMCLSTCSCNTVTSRMISFIFYNQSLFFQTDKKSRKYMQMKDNNKVSICKDNMQIEGVAELVGSTNNKQNLWFTELYKKSFPNAYNRYSNLNDEVIIKVNIKYIAIWSYDDNGPYQEIINISNKSYKQIRCDSINI